jgi:hypothetical protein
MGYEARSCPICRFNLGAICQFNLSDMSIQLVRYVDSTCAYVDSICHRRRYQEITVKERAS